MGLGAGVLGGVAGVGLAAALRWDGASRIAAVAVAAVIGVFAGLLFSGPGEAMASAFTGASPAAAARPGQPPVLTRKGLPWNLDVLQARYPYEYGRIAALSRNNPAAGEMELQRLTTPIYADVLRRQLPLMDAANARDELKVLTAIVRRISGNPALCAQVVNDPYSVGSDADSYRIFGRALVERERKMEAAILEQTALRPEQAYDLGAARAILAPLMREAAAHLSPADLQVIARSGPSGPLTLEQGAIACRLQVELMSVMSSQDDAGAARAMRAMAVVMRDSPRG